MEVLDFLFFLQKAREKELEEQIRQQWVIQLPHMTKESYISFDDYFDKVTGRNIDTRPANAIIKEIEELHKTKGVML